MLLTSSQHPARVSGVASLATRLADLPPTAPVMHSLSKCLE